MSIFNRINNIRSRTVFFLGIALMPLIVLASLPGHDKREFTDQFPILDCPGGFSTSQSEGAANRYFQLAVGRVLYLNNQTCIDDGECDELEEVWVTVLDETELVDGTWTRVVEEREAADGEVFEISRNFYAECIGTEDVYYFGEDVVDGDGQPLPDGWRAGVNGARAGLIMSGGAFLLGSRYFQEVAEGVALDRGENVAMGLSVEVPASEGEPGGVFENCVQVNDTNALEDPKGKEVDEKLYCPGIGLVKDEEAELVSISQS